MFESRLDARNLNRLPGVAGDAGAVGDLWLAAASTAGLSHMHGARTCQDSYSFATTKDSSALVVAVADGLGSRPETSQVGAMLISRAVCEAVATLKPEDLQDEELESLVGARVVEASERAAGQARAWLPEVAAGDLASTVAFGWIPLGGSGASLFGRVGDCGVFRLTTGEFDTLFEQDDHALNVVGGWLPAEEVGDILELHLVTEPLDTVVLATDGLTEDIFGSPAVRKWLATCWGDRCGVFRMIDSLRYRRRGSHDDRTGLVVWINESSSSTPDTPEITSAVQQSGDDGGGS